MMKRMALRFGVFMALVLAIVAAVPVAGQGADPVDSGNPPDRPESTADVPVTAEDWQALGTEVAKLTPSDGPVTWFASSVSVDGDTAIVGAQLADVGGNYDQGAAYVYYRDQGGPGTWRQVAKLTAADGTIDDEFGVSVSLDGDMAVVGAHFAPAGGNQWQGAAYVYYRDEGGPDGWGQVAKLGAGSDSESEEFGHSVSIVGDTILVGAPYYDLGGFTANGAAYVFYRNQGGPDAWGQVAELTADDGASYDQFGTSVSVTGDAAVVGMPQGDDLDTTGPGAAYIFYRNQGGADAWGQVAKLTAGDGALHDLFGGSVSLYGDTAFVGAYGADIGGNPWQGAAYVFCRDQGGAGAWGEVAKLTLATQARLQADFGFSVSISGDTAVVGAIEQKVGRHRGEGAAYVFSRNEGGTDAWGQVERLTASDGGTYDHLGYSASVDGSTALIGALGEGAYVYALPALHLRSLDLAWEYGTQPGSYRVTATVRVHNEHHARTGGATVDGDWTLPDGSIRHKTALSNREGEARLNLWVTHTGTYQFCVTDLVKAGYGYDPGANETPACQSLVVGP